MSKAVTLITPKQASKITGISYASLAFERKVNGGSRLSYYKKLTDNRVYYDKNEVVEYAAGLKVNSRTLIHITTKPVKKGN